MNDHPLLEHGFWDYTTPGAGGMERYGWDDYRWLLDDMASARMNSLLVMVKWFTTGYRSRLPELDQATDNPVIASDNELLRRVFTEARGRGIRPWVGGVVTAFPVRAFPLAPAQGWAGLGEVRFPEPVGFFDTDVPGLLERSLAVAREIVTQFPAAAGFLVELEHCGFATPHRIPRYDAWAKERGLPAFAELCRNLNPRCFDHPSWRDYTTERRVEFLQAIERDVRAAGFAGELATIFETNRTPYYIGHEVNLELVRRHCPAWAGVTYEYEKDTQRAASMDFAVTVPRQFGFKVYYLPRGVMTWSWPAEAWPRPLSLAQGWAADAEDLRRFRPDGVWWFGSGTVNDGLHVDRQRLQAEGYPDGRAARRALLETIRTHRR